MYQEFVWDDDRSCFLQFHLYIIIIIMANRVKIRHQTLYDTLGVTVTKVKCYETKRRHTIIIMLSS